MQLEDAKDQRHGRHNQHENNEDVFLRGPGDVAVDWVRTRPGLREGDRVLDYRPSALHRTQHQADRWFYLADIQRMEEDPIEEVLETQEDHLGGGGSVSKRQKL